MLEGCVEFVVKLVVFVFLFLVILSLSPELLAILIGIWLLKIVFGG